LPIPWNCQSLCTTYPVERAAIFSLRLQ